MEDKQKIAMKLMELLKLTEFGDLIDSIEYIEDEYGDYLEETLTTGYVQRFDVTGDSGIRMIRKVVRGY